jgi:hypothetical protein
MKTIILAGAAVAAMTIGLASAQAQPVRHAPPAYGTVNGGSAPGHGPNGYYLGGDPDAFIRGQISRDPNLGNQSQ